MIDVDLDEFLALLRRAKRVRPRLHLIIKKDFESGNGAGAGGTFQITELSIEQSNGDSVDISGRFDRGKHFHSDHQLKEYIAEVLEISVASIHLTEA